MSAMVSLLMLAVQDGEKVVYSKYAGTELKLQGKEYVILKVCFLY
jgi:co-chaperonin GroES (HSP10)